MDSEAFAATYTGKSPFSGVAYSTYYHNKDKFNGNVILNGVDVSTYQNGAKSDYGKAQTNGVDFVIARVTWTGYTKSKHSYKNLDDQFANHYKKAKAAGQLMGAYVFSQAKTVTEAENEASFAVERLQALGIKPGDLDLPVYMDYEYAGPSSEGRLYGISKSTATKCAKAFCNKIAALGYTPGIYACLSFLNSSVDGTSLGQTYDIWCAQYYNTCDFTGTYSKWQYSSAAKIDGVYNSSSKPTSTDVNFWYLDAGRTSSDSADIASCKIAGPTQVKYTGSAVKPAFTVTKGSKKLTKGTDYTIGYVRNVKKGTGYAYIRGIGSYTGYKLVPFEITDKVKEAAEEKPIESVEPESAVTENIGISGITNEAGECGLSLNQTAGKVGVDFTETELTGVVAGSNAEAIKTMAVLGEGYEDYSVKVIDATTGKEIGDDKTVKTGDMLAVYDGEGELAATLRIVADVQPEIILSKTEYSYYSGSTRKPSVTVKLGNYTVAEKLTASNNKVTLSYASGRKLPGTYTVTVKCKGSISGTYKTSFSIKMIKTDITKLTGKTKAFKATWVKRKSGYVTGYQVQYSRYSDMSNDLKKKATKYSTISKTFKTNYSNYKYYVRIRTYKTISGKTYYSDWSDKYTVNVK